MIIKILSIECLDADPQEDLQYQFSPTPLQKCIYLPPYSLACLLTSLHPFSLHPAALHLYKILLLSFHFKFYSSSTTHPHFISTAIHSSQPMPTPLMSTLIPSYSILPGKSRILHFESIPLYSILLPLH